MTKPVPRCVVADDHPALLRAVCSYLADNGFDVAGEAESGDQVLALVERERPELALVDYRMPRSGGAELVRRLGAASPSTRVAVYTADADESLVGAVLEAGAAAVVLKEAPLADLVRALHAVLEGRAYVDAGLAARSLGAPAGDAPCLTAREVEVLGLLAEGLSHEQVGLRLRISAETARTHLRKACVRLGAATRTEAVARAIRLGLI